MFVWYFFVCRFFVHLFHLLQKNPLQTHKLDLHSYIPPRKCQLITARIKTSRYFFNFYIYQYGYPAIPYRYYSTLKYAHKTLSRSSGQLKFINFTKNYIFSQVLKRFIPCFHTITSVSIFIRLFRETLVITQFTKIIHSLLKSTTVCLLSYKRLLFFIVFLPYYRTSIPYIANIHNGITVNRSSALEVQLYQPLVPL